MALRQKTYKVKGSAYLAHNIRLANPQTPDEKRLQQPPEQKDACPGKGLKEPLDLMRRGHVPFLGFDAAGIALILSELIEVDQSPAGPIDKKAKDLFEQFHDADAFAVFADRAEPLIKPAENVNAVEISHEQGQAGAAGQTIGSCVDAMNFQFSLSVFFAMFAHRVLHQWGVLLFATTLFGFSKHYSILNH